MWFVLLFSNLQDCSTKEATFFAQFEYKPYVELGETPATVQQFLQAYNSEYDVYLETRIGQLHTKQSKKRVAQLSTFANLLKNSKFLSGNSYVGCTMISYTRKMSTKTIMRLNACSEFILSTGNQYALKFLFEMYQRAEADLEALSHPIVKRLYKLFSVMMPDLNIFEEQTRRIEDLTRIIESSSASTDATLWKAARKELAQLSRERNKRIQDLLPKRSSRVPRTNQVVPETNIMNDAAKTLRITVRDIDSSATCVSLSPTYWYTASATCRAINIFISHDDPVE